MFTRGYGILTLPSEGRAGGKGNSREAEIRFVGYPLTHAQFRGVLQWVSETQQWISEAPFETPMSRVGSNIHILPGPPFSVYMSQVPLIE